MMPGVYPSEEVSQAVGASDVLVVVIDADRVDEELRYGSDRLLRREIETAIQNNLPIIPVFLDFQLDTTIKIDATTLGLIRLSDAVHVRRRGFNDDVLKLCHIIEEYVRVKSDAPRVFLSYAHVDEEAVLAVDQWLRDRGARVDIDKRNFVAGYDLREEILRCIAEAGKVVVFYSSGSEGRYYTKLERRIVEEREAKQHDARSGRAAILVYFRLDETSLPGDSSHRLAINAWQMGFDDACRELWRHLAERPGEAKQIDLTKYRKRAPWQPQNTT
jgi:hypothetical protein